MSLKQRNIRVDPRTKEQATYFTEIVYRKPLDPVVTAYADPKIAFISAHIPIRGRILDIGCGNGIFTSRLARTGASVTGLDFSEKVLSNNSHSQLTCGDATNLPFADATFDFVFEANLLHHVQNRAAALQEMARVSRKYIAVLEPNRYNPLMFGFGVVVKAERGLLVSTPKRLHEEMEAAGVKVTASITTGMISQNNTPSALIPFLRRFNKQIWWGEYIIVVGVAAKGVAAKAVAANGC